MTSGTLFEAGNVDPSEIAKFEALANRWWDRNSEFKPLHDINPLRMSFIDAQVNLAGLNVLDVGCGGGILSEAMAHRGAFVTGIDMGEAPLGVARLHLLESKLSVNYQQASAETFAKTHAGEFQVITCLEMLEHVPEPSSVLKACFDMLAPGGHLSLSTTNRNPKAYALAVVAAEYVLGMLPRGTHDYRKFIKPSELGAMARANGLALQKMTGLGYNPLTRRYQLGEDVDVNYMMYFTRPAD